MNVILHSASNDWRSRVFLRWLQAVNVETRGYLDLSGMDVVLSWKRQDECRQQIEIAAWEHLFFYEEFTSRRKEVVCNSGCIS